MKSKSKRKGTHLKKRRVPKYQEGGRPTDVQQLLSYLNTYQGGNAMVPTDPYDIPVAQVNLPVAEVATDGSVPAYSPNVPEQIAKTEGDLAAVYQNLGSQGVTDYLDMTGGVIDAQNKFYEDYLELPLMFTPMGNPAMMNMLLREGVDTDDLPSLVAAAGSAAMRKMPSGPAVGGVLRQGAEDVKNFFRRMMGKDPKITARTSDIVGQQGRFAGEVDRLASGMSREGRELELNRMQGQGFSSSGMYDAAEAAAREAEILMGEEAVFGRRSLPGGGPRLEAPGTREARNLTEGAKLGELAAAKMPYKDLKGMTQQEMAAAAPSGDLDRAEQFSRELALYQENKFDEAYGDVGSGGNVQQIPSLMIGGELEKRANKQGLIPKAQMAQFLSKGGLSEFDKIVLTDALMDVDLVKGKKGKEFYDLNSVRQNTADLLGDRFEYDETQSYSDYGFRNLQGPRSEINDIGTQLIIANPQNPIARNYIGSDSGHWRGISPNVVGHYRGFVRGGSLADTRTLYIGEMQSDVAQRGRFIQDRYGFVKDFPSDLMELSPTQIEGEPAKYAYSFPDDAYNNFFARNAVVNPTVGKLRARNPHELFQNIGPTRFDIEDLSPTGVSVKEQLLDVVKDGSIDESNAFLYDVKWWMNTKAQVTNLFPDFHDLNRKYKMLANELFSEAIKAHDGGNPTLEFLRADQQFRGQSISSDLQLFAGEIIDALEKNDVNPPGTFTDANIQSEYDTAIEGFNNAVEEMEGTLEEMQEVFGSGEIYDDIKDFAKEKGGPYDERVQKAFVKNQDEFLLSQIIGENFGYDAIRFPTGVTTGIIQGYTSSPRRVQEQIESQQQGLQIHQQDYQRAQNQLDSPLGQYENTPTPLDNGDATLFGQQIESLGSDVQQLLFDTPLVSQGKSSLTGDDLMQDYMDKQSIQPDWITDFIIDPDGVYDKIYRGELSMTQQKAAHSYNFMKFARQWRNGSVTRAMANANLNLFRTRLEMYVQAAPRVDGKLYSSLDKVMAVNASGLSPERGEELAGMYEQFKMGSGELETRINSIVDDAQWAVDQLPADQDRLVVTKLPAEDYLSGAFLEHPDYQAYQKYRGADQGIGAMESLSTGFENYLFNQRFFTPHSILDRMRMTTEDVVNLYIDNFAQKTYGQDAGSTPTDMNIAELYGSARKSSMHDKVPVHMPIAANDYVNSNVSLEQYMQQPGLMMEKDMVFKHLLDEVNKIYSLHGVTDLRAMVTYSNFSEEVETLSKNLRRGAEAKRREASVLTHIASLQGQLDAIRRGDGVSDSHKTVMKSYDRLPKIAKKLGYELKPVTDEHGNTWFELKIPKSLQQSKGEVRGYRQGGRIKVKKRSPFKVIKK